MAHRRPDRSYSASARRPYKRRPSVRSLLWRIRNVAFLIALGVVGLGSIRSGLDGKTGGEAQSLMSGAASNVFYRYCSDARAAGAAPLHTGDAGYRSELDRDGDGVACEPYYGG